MRQTDRAVPVVGVRAEPMATGERAPLDARGVIDRAMATLTTRSGMTERAAFRWLQRTAMDHRSSIRAIAWLVIAGRPARTATSVIGDDGRPKQRRRPE